MTLTKALPKNLLFKAMQLICVLGVTFQLSLSARAEQYASGAQQLVTSQGIMLIHSGYVSHFNANDFYVYSFMFQPKESKEWHQVPRIEKEKDAKMLFTVQTKHTPEAILFDAKVIADKQNIYLITGSKETANTLADDGPVDVTVYELVKLDDYERWVFMQKKTQKTAPKISVEMAIQGVGKTLVK